MARPGREPHARRARPGQLERGHQAVFQGAKGTPHHQRDHVVRFESDEENVYRVSKTWSGPKILAAAVGGGGFFWDLWLYWTHFESLLEENSLTEKHSDFSTNSLRLFWSDLTNGFVLTNHPFLLKGGIFYRYILAGMTAEITA